MGKKIYFNGPVLTLEKPLYAESLLIDGGKIAGLGSLREMKELAPDAALCDLAGKTIMPAFIDPHSHFSGYASSLLQVPLDECISIVEIQKKIGDYIQKKRMEPGQWVVAKGYDHNGLAEKRHITAKELDEVSPDNPVVIQHKSGHMGIFNSRALGELGVTTETAAPAGGRIEIKDGYPTGYMEENAFLFYQRSVPTASAEELMEAYEKAQEIYLSHGIATVQEGMLPAALIPLYRELLARRILKVDLVAFPAEVDAFEVKKELESHWGTYREHVKVGGCKIFLDGSPQGRTAWMREPYETVQADDEPTYCGYNTLTDEQVYDACKLALKQGLQLLAHCNGDAAAEQYIRAWERLAEKTGPDRIRSLRPVMIHAQLLGTDQLTRVKELGIIPSFFVAHVYHWGDVHLKNFGYARASHISCAGSALKKGIIFTFHQDAPVIEPDMLETVWCAVTRTTKSGRPLGAGEKPGTDERISVLDAIRAVTLHAAYQYREEDTKGSLKVGKNADFIILDKDPLHIPAEELKSIRVLETVKDGVSVFRPSTGGTLAESQKKTNVHPV